MDKLKDMKDEVLVVTNASDGNNPQVVERIENDGALKTQPLAKAKPDGDFLRIDRSESILEAFFSNFKRQYNNPSDFRFYHLPTELLAAAKDMVDLFRKPEENSAMLDGYKLDPEQYAQKQDLQQAPRRRKIHAATVHEVGHGAGGLATACTYGHHPRIVGRNRHDTVVERA